VVVGNFDPVLAGHARRMSGLADGSGALMTIVADPPHPILTAPARAELVAALAAVDHVVLPGDTPLEDLIAKLEATEIVRAEAADQELTRELIRHVQRRS